MKRQLKIIVLLIYILIFYTAPLIAQERDEVGHRVGPWSEGSKCGLKFKARKQYYYEDKNTPFTMQFEITNTGRKASFEFDVNSTGVAPDRYYRRVTLDNGQVYKNVETRNSEKVYFFFDKFCYNFHYFGMSEMDDCSTDPSVTHSKYYYATCGASNEKYIPPTPSGSIKTNTNPSTYNATNNNTVTNSNHDGGAELMPPGGRKSTAATTNTNTKPLTAQEIQQQQQFSQQAQQQQQIAEQQQRQQTQYDQQLLQYKQAMDLKHEQQQQELQKQQERQAYANQINDAMNQKAIANIQNTPITKLEVNKIDIKDVKKAASTGIDKGTISGIVESTPIEMEFPELTKKNQMPNPDIFTDPKPSLPSFNVMETLESHINMIHPLVGGIMKVELTIGVEGKVINVSTVSSPENKELELKLSSQILNNVVYYFKPAYKNSDPITGKLSYTVSYSSSDDRAKKLKAQNTEKTKNSRIVPLDNGQDYTLKDDEEVIETSKVNIINGYSQTAILAKFNEFKNSIKDNYKYLTETDLITMLQDANKSGDKTTVSNSTSSSQTIQYAIIHGRLCSVKRLDSKTTVYTYVD